MADPELDQLFIIAQASPLLDEVESALRQSGYENEAADLLRLQQDTGIQIDREINGYDENEPVPGPETARLNAAYQPVTTGRLNLLTGIRDLLEKPELASQFRSFTDSLNLPSAPQVAPRPENRNFGL